MDDIDEMEDVEEDEPDFDENIMDTLDTTEKYLCLAIASCSAVLNLTVCVVYILLKRRIARKVSHFLLLVTSFGDIVTTSILWFFAISIILDKFDDTEDFLVEILTKYSFVLTLLILLLCAVDRFCAVVVPLWHSTKVTFRSIVLASISLWFLSAIPPLVRAVLLRFTVENLDDETDTTFMHVFHGVSLFIILVVLVLLAITYVKCRSAIREHYLNFSTASTASENEVRNVKRQKRLIVIFLIMATTFLVTYLPKLVFETLLVAEYLGGVVDTELEEILHKTFNMLYYTSSLANPVITLLFNKDYRDTLTSFARRS